MNTRTWMAGALLLCAAHTAWAEPDALASNTNTGNLWLNIGALSTHLNESQNYNGNNWGVGLEYGLTPDVSLMGGRFNNSVHRNSNYAAIGWQPWRWGAWKIGAALGVMDGYPAVDNGNSFFAALPLASYEGKRFGVNLAVIPSLPNIDGALVVQLKMRLR
jgi:hypothetical protein